MIQKLIEMLEITLFEATYCDSVIEITKTLPQYELTEYDCSSIFKERAFANERPLPLDLKKIGKEIVKKCKRVPWAARFLGGIMYFIRDNGPKWANALFSEIKHLCALILKLNREMPLFCNSIILKSSYMKYSILI